MQNRDIKKYVVELGGTFLLTLLVSLMLSSALGALAPLMAAFVVGLFVYIVGHVSGAHFNPAVTVGAWSLGRISMHDAIGYLVSQFAGAALSAIIVFKGLKLSLAAAPVVGGGWQAFGMVVLAEAVGMFIFAFSIAAVVFGKVPEAAKGLVIGMALFLGLMFSSGLGASGIINPAVAFGIDYFSWMYIVGPLIGGVLGMKAYKFLAVE